MTRTKTTKERGEDLLIELLTEELPPKSLKRLSEAFATGVYESLRAQYFLTEHSTAEAFVTPRRLAVRVSGVLPKQPERTIERKGPSVATGADATGRPTPALLGFARSCGVDPAKLHRQKDDKGEYFMFRAKQKGEVLAKHLAPLVEAALKKLPVAKLMRWGARDVEFVRPVHGLMMLYGSKVVPGTVLGFMSGNKTQGHRFLSKGPVVVKRADQYEVALRTGKVEPSFEKRRKQIKRELAQVAAQLAAEVTRKPGGRTLLGAPPFVIDTEDDRDVGKMFPGSNDLEASERAQFYSGGSALLDEVTALVEWSKVLSGRFDPEFLTVPVECLALTMKQNQKYFPVFDRAARLLPYFVVIANNQGSATVRKNIELGNERVVKPRLADARFFFEQDRKTKLEDRVPELANVVYHNKLGSQLDRTKRIASLAEYIIRLLGGDPILANRAACLAKTDLLTNMVGEFPELQGVMGRYYALADGESDIVASAIASHYRPRTSTDRLPEGHVACSIALADKVETLVGMFGVGLLPTGDKDPYGLRRAAIGILRILVENQLPLDLKELLERARPLFTHAPMVPNVTQQVQDFFYDRLRSYLRDKGYAADEIEAVLSLRPTRFDQIPARLEAIRKFRALPEGIALSAANKRIRNILRQAGTASSATEVKVALLQEDAEKRLAEEVQSATTEVGPLLDSGDYAHTLQRLARLRPVVDDFFDRVMVMVDDSAVRGNRLALLNRLGNLFLRVADVSRLQG